MIIVKCRRGTVYFILIPFFIFIDLAFIIIDYIIIIFSRFVYYHILAAIYKIAMRENENNDKKVSDRVPRARDTLQTLVLGNNF